MGHGTCQVIGIMGETMFKNLRAHKNFHDDIIHRALRGDGLPGLALGTLEAAFQEGS